MDQETLSNLAIRFMDGDEEAFSKLVNRLTPLFRRIAERRIGQKWADDTVQETMLALFTSLRNGKWSQDRCGVGTFASSILKNQIRVTARSQKRESDKKPVRQESYNPNHGGDSRISEITNMLSDDEILIFRMIGDDVPFSKIANTFGTTIGQLKMQVSRLRSQISERTNS